MFFHCTSMADIFHRVKKIIDDEWWSTVTHTFRSASLSPVQHYTIQNSSPASCSIPTVVDYLWISVTVNCRMAYRWTMRKCFERRLCIYSWQPCCSWLMSFVSFTHLFHSCQCYQTSAMLDWQPCRLAASAFTWHSTAMSFFSLP